MNLPPGIAPLVAEITRRFGDRIDEVRCEQPGEVVFYGQLELVPGFCGQLYKKWNARLVSVFADDTREESGVFRLRYIYALDSLHVFFILCVPVSANHPEFTSLTNPIPAVNWQEREIQDLFGLKLLGHPNPRRCALHDDWPEVHPLRKDFDLHTQLPPFTGERHRLRTVGGEGVFQVPVGPVHAGIIEPGHFLFSVAGEPVLHLQLRLFYTHKATEKLFENMPVPHGVQLAESISGDSSFAHATAFGHAVERAAGVTAPPRARALRTICLELERLCNHIADIGAIATDVAFVVANMHALRLKERLLRLNELLTGNRLLRGMARLGGVRFDWSVAQFNALGSTLRELRPEFDSLVALIEASSSTRDRLEGTGVLKPEVARDLGVVGVAGRASGFDGDLRRDFPHAAYDLVTFRVPVYRAGDVMHRMQVRIDEVHESLAVIGQLLANLPSGPLHTEVGELPADRTALGWVEGWRGEIFHWVRTAPGNRLARCKVKDPSLQNWPALCEAILGNIIPDFPVVNKSFNLSVFGNRPLIMFDILRKSLRTGVVTTRFPESAPELAAGARGNLEIDLERWRDARSAARVCPTGAIECTDSAGTRTVTVDLGKCTFCGLCAETDPAIRLTNQCLLATAKRDQLKSTANYALAADGTQQRLLDRASGASGLGAGAPAVDKLGQELRARINRLFGRSLHIREVDAGSCNGCEVEIVGLGGPVYDVERFGIHFVASPRHADMLLVTGPVTRNMELALRKTYDAMPGPRLVVAVGACGCSGGIFGLNYATRGGVDRVLPVDVYIPGCPPNPHALMHGILIAIGRLENSAGALSVGDPAAGDRGDFTNRNG